LRIVGATRSHYNKKLRLLRGDCWHHDRLASVIAGLAILKQNEPGTVSLS
jgi:hypothetical protein